MFAYLNANKTAGYSGFVVWRNGNGQACAWMIPGTFFDDWDNQ